jgi:hypothetical protein
MSKANQRYENGQFTEAIEIYQSLVEQGVKDGRLYYNLGNAYFKTGDLGRAVLNYRRAQDLLPRDEDVATNLQLARAQTQDRLEREESGALVQFVRRLLMEWTTLNEIATLALGLWILLCGLFIIVILAAGATKWHRVRRLLGYVMLGVGILLALSLLSIGLRVTEVRNRPPAVIVAPSVEVRSGPGTDYLTEFTLHAGAEVRVLERRDTVADATTWVRITLPGDLQGWIPDNTVEGVYPLDSKQSTSFVQGDDR